MGLRSVGLSAVVLEDVGLFDFSSVSFAAGAPS